MARGTIRYWAAAREAAGAAEEPYDADTLGEALAGARARHTGTRAFADVISRCSFLVDGQPVGSRDPGDVVLPEGGTVEVLPPFAGGSAPTAGAPRGVGLEGRGAGTTPWVGPKDAEAGNTR